MEELIYKKQSAYEKAPEKTAAALEYARGYMQFLDEAKTEREATEAAIKLAEAKGYKEYKIGDKIEKGDKLYLNNRQKSVYFVKVGSEDIENGIRITAAHIDSPRIDLKPVPLYESDGMAFLKTHYYGGIRKYQWTATPLAMHGVVIKADGSTAKITIGECDSDPVFYINDLLPHLAQNQSKEPISTAIKGETLNILCGSEPLSGEESDGIKKNVLKLLNEKYGINESDFISAELSLVPAAKARDIGLDRALIGAYGHDDRVCAYPALTALLNSSDSTHTVMCVLADKEETGSIGVTGMQSQIFTDLLDEIAIKLGANPRVVRGASMCLSADVTAAYDPNFPEVYEKRNSAIIGSGVSISKYTGSRGKSSTSDANAEFVGKIRMMLDSANVVWQSAELGKVDEGGGGTVAAYIANRNIDTLDIGVPVISMHAPYEVVSKVDVYAAYEAFAAFCDK